jgi:tetratricopeptide (TPR) repeat protein
MLARIVGLLMFLIPVCALAQWSPDAEQCSKSDGSVDERIAVCTRAVTSGKLPPEVLASTLNNRGNAWYAKGDPDRAIADYNESIRVNPHNAHAYNNRGNAWQGKGEYGRAITDYNEAIRINPRYANAYYNRGNAWVMEKNDYDRAIADYNEAIRLNPDNADYYFSRAAAWNSKGDFHRAIADFNKAFKLNPNKT